VFTINIRKINIKIHATCTYVYIKYRWPNVR